MFSVFKHENLKKLKLDQLKNVRKLIDKNKQDLKAIENKEIFLLMGNSRTNLLADYLSGAEMVAETESLSNQQNGITKRGPAYNELVPYLIASKDNILFCPCPSFNKNSISDSEFYKSLAIEKAILSAKTIRGIFFVIDFNSFFTNRCQDPKDLIATLNLLFPNCDELKKSVSFLVVNKPIAKPNEDIYKIITYSLQSIITRKKEERLDAEAKWWALFKNNLIVIDFFDNGKDLPFLHQTIKTANPIQINSFNFKKYETSRIALNEILDAGIKEIELIKQLESDMDEATDSLQKEENNLLTVCKQYDAKKAEQNKNESSNLIKLSINQESDDIVLKDLDLQIQLIKENIIFIVDRLKKLKQDLSVSQVNFKLLRPYLDTVLKNYDEFMLEKSLYLRMKQISSDHKKYFMPTDITLLVQNSVFHLPLYTFEETNHQRQRRTTGVKK